MATCTKILLAALALGIIAPSAQGAAQKPISVCKVSAEAKRFVGKRIRVEGYLFDLGSHGVVLASKRTCTGQGQLALKFDRAALSPLWSSAFAKSVGPKRAILVGIVRWKKARPDGFIPGLDVERVETIAVQESAWSDF